MLSSYIVATQAEIYKLEFYRNNRPEISTADTPASSFGEQKSPGWYYMLLARIGDLLIVAGTRLKKSAQFPIALHQETL